MSRTKRLIEACINDATIGELTDAAEAFAEANIFRWNSIPMSSMTDAHIGAAIEKIERSMIYMDAYPSLLAEDRIRAMQRNTLRVDSDTAAARLRAQVMRLGGKPCA